jgi:hypothetical protein
MRGAVATASHPVRYVASTGFADASRRQRVTLRSPSSCQKVAATALLSGANCSTDDDDDDAAIAVDSHACMMMVPRRLLLVAGLLVAAVGIRTAAASAGDQDPDYRACVSACSDDPPAHARPPLALYAPHPHPCALTHPATEHASLRTHCLSLSLSLSLLGRSLRLLQWSWVDNCRYECMHQVVAARLRRGAPVQQYHGKWPFVRVLGVQEPASVLFSLANLAGYLIGFPAFWATIRHDGFLSKVCMYAYVCACMHVCVCVCVCVCVSVSVLRSVRERESAHVPAALGYPSMGPYTLTASACCLWLTRAASCWR